MQNTRIVIISDPFPWLESLSRQVNFDTYNGLDMVCRFASQHLFRKSHPDLIVKTPSIPGTDTIYNYMSWVSKALWDYQLNSLSPTKQLKLHHLTTLITHLKEFYDSLINQKLIPTDTHSLFVSVLSGYRIELDFTRTP